MNTLTATLRRLMASAELAVVSFFDRGVENLIADLTKLDSKLDRFAERKASAAARAFLAADASFERQEAIIEAERALRGKLYDREAYAAGEARRATRIRDRIRSLVD